MTGAFSDDLSDNARDPEFARAYADDAIRINRIDSFVNAQYDADGTANAPDNARENAADVAAFDAAMAEEGENIPWAQVGVCEFGATSAELQALLGDRLPAFQDWMSGQTMGVCPEHGPVVYRSDLERFLAGGPVLD